MLKNPIKIKLAKNQGKRLYFRRKAMGMTLSELSKALGIHPDTLRKVEEGMTIMSKEKHQKALTLFFVWKNNMIKELEKEIEILNNLLNE